MSYNAALISSSLLSPLTLSFCLGAIARFVRSELTVPKDVYAGISLFLLFAIGL
ncbi:MAG: sodium-dependent bicarbonate transport family permease, partial [Pseudomonadota bacterium]